MVVFLWIGGIIVVGSTIITLFTMAIYPRQ